MPSLLSDDREGKIIENIDFKYLSNRASPMGNPVHTAHLDTRMPRNKKLKSDIWSHGKSRNVHRRSFYR